MTNQASQESRCPGRRFSWTKLSSTISCFTIAGFVAVSLLAKWTPAQAQDAQPPKKAPEVKQKQKKTAPAPEFTAPVPAAGTKVDATALAKIIDQEIGKLLTAEKIPTSPQSADTEFLRRVYLDLVGVIPSPEKVKAFLDSKEPGKRAKVIDELLADPRFGEHLAEMWTEIMVTRDSNNKRIDHKPLQKWLADGFNANKPINQLVYELITASGSVATNGAAGYFVANPSADKITDNVSRMFLGVQLQCAQCHNHPFTDYKQNEYWAMAAFFMKVQTNAANPAAAAKKGDALTVSEVPGPAKAKKKLPEGAKVVPAKFLHGAEPTIKNEDPSRPVLAKWLTAPENPFFARAIVNRVWHRAFGRGLVNPVDDMHDDNPATHPELLAALAEQFKTNGYDLRYLLRAIYATETYQRTSRPTGDNGSDTTLYSHRLVRVMSPEQFYDSMVLAVGKTPEKSTTQPKQKGPPLTTRDNFTNFFRVDEGSANPLEYQIGIPQALRLMNAGQFNNTNEAINEAMAAGKTPALVLENLYLRTLSRPPSPEEVQRFTAHVNKAANPRTGYADVFWALLNSSEFAFNH